MEYKITAEREVELEELFWYESNDPETWGWRDDLTPDEAALVDSWDERVAVGMSNMAKAISKLNVPENSQQSEVGFTKSPGNAFAIYQLKNDDALREIRFESMSYLQSIGRSVVLDNYDLVYSAPLAIEGSTPIKLEALFEQFNVKHPADFKGHSLSVSDVVVLKQSGFVSCHYVDSFGFRFLPDFLNRTQLSEKSNIAEITNILDAVNASYLAIGRSDRGVYGSAIFDGPSIYNPRYFGGDAYEADTKELKDYAHKLYEQHFGVTFEPGVPIPDQPGPFYGKIEHISFKGDVVETRLYTDEVEYLNAYNDKHEYGVPLCATRLTANEYNEALSKQAVETDYQEIVEEENSQEWGDD